MNFEKSKKIEKEPRQEINKELKEELWAMYKKDQEVSKSGKIDVKMNKKHTARMKDILKEYGWPGKSLVDIYGANAAWLLVQHSDHDVEFQKEALRLLKKAVEEKEARKSDLAYLIDRVRVNSGEPQLFGTQFYTNKKGEFVPRPIEDIEHLDERRRSFELEPFDEYKEKVRDFYKKGD